MKVKIILLLSICLFLPFNKGVFRENQKNPWPSIIGHGMFGIDGVTYTNSKEAFITGYQKGLRIFEIDLELTSDDKLVLTHDWHNYQSIPTSEFFLTNKIKDKYTPLSIEDILLLLKIYPDVWFITDSKYTEEKMIIKEFKYLVQVAKNLNLVQELDRLVIQLYYQKMYNIIESIYDFKYYLYTMYMNWDYNYNHFAEICEWGKDKLEGIVLFKDSFSVNLLNIVKKYDLDLYVHTVNDLMEAKKLLREGVQGIYSDFITDL